MIEQEFSNYLVVSLLSSKNKTQDLDIKKVKSKNKLKVLLEDYFKDPERSLCSIGSFKVKDFLTFNKVLSGEKGYFIIFDNAGGSPFMIWELSTKQELKSFIKHVNNRVFAYRIGDKDTIVKNLPNY